MRYPYYNDPLLILVQNRQAELLREADNNRLAGQAKGLQDSDGRPMRENKRVKVPVWRRTARVLGRAAFNLGAWLMAR